MGCGCVGTGVCFFFQIKNRVVALAKNLFMYSVKHQTATKTAIATSERDVLCLGKEKKEYHNSMQLKPFCETCTRARGVEEGVFV